MKKFLPLLLAVFCSASIYAQLNMELADQLEYNDDLNDIWGWADPETGIEYALVGLRNGVSIVSLEDKNNVVEVARIPGQPSTWRDLKTWGSYAYVTTDQGGTTEGVTVIDLSNLPEEAPYYHWTPEIEGLGTILQCHNIYIDEFGYGYLAGCNINNGGMLILNVDTETGEPEFVSAAPPIYAHDVFVMNNHMYSSELFIGQMAIYDVSDKQNLELLGIQPTPFNFTHNIWVNEDETVAFTTDEVANAPVAAYDITNFAEIEELDQYRPAASLGSNVIPHNVHVWNDYLLISYYTDGGKIVDASRPENLVEVGNFDTWFGNDGGFSGAWGLYPFLPSRTVLVSDINSGLYVLEPTFVRACWLEGVVRDSITQTPLSEVEVEILSEQANFASTDAFGNFETGQALSGTFEVRFSKSGYRSKTVEVELANDELTALEVELFKLPLFALQARVEDETGAPVPNAKIQVVNNDFTYELTADVQGAASLDEVVQGDYDIIAGAWGYLHQVEAITLNTNGSYTIVLEEGYQDDFIFDLGWISDSDNLATSGFWELGDPIGTTLGAFIANPGEDVADDLGTQCYVTGNGGGNGGSDDVDGGEVILRSPYMDLSDYEKPMLSFDYWFFNGGGVQGGPAPDDTLTVALVSPDEEVVLQAVATSSQEWTRVEEFPLTDLITLRDSMQLVFRTEDLATSGHILEAGIDKVLVMDEEEVINSTGDIAAANVQLQTFPNPFQGEFNISFRIPGQAEKVSLQLFNTYGQLVEQRELSASAAQLTMGRQLTPGLYLLRLSANGEVLRTEKVVRVR
jgi:choice-of-anchor B domain-containing protein